MTSDADTATQIAVIGLACRLPGASSPDALWRNLAGGVESIAYFDERGRRTPEPPGRVASGPILAGGVLDDPGAFDAAFFDCSPREATLLDPQQRVFLECAHEALEHAGYDPARYKGSIGVYAGGSETSYLATLRAHRDALGGADDWQLRLATGVDFLTSRVAYKLGLRGPAITVQTACSTSLVAIHLAAQALLAGDCTMALAGGASLHVPTLFGHYTEGGVLSPDGRCRAFDADAEGTVGSDGVVLVLLKPLEDALADGDHVHAVLLGSAINNDAAAKVGFTAPSVEGQAKVIRAALAVAGVPPESVGYVEAHGTGTQLGDPVEVAALTKAYGAHARARGSCALGSIKSNIGHTDAAAGAAGFLKAVLALWHRELPPSLHLRTPNPRIAWDEGPFVVGTTLQPWASDGPRRAAVSSLGIGGTNAHAVLEETPDRGVDARPPSWELLVLSAKTPRALDAVAARLRAELTARPRPLADVAWTLQRGRQVHAHRRAFVARDAASAVEALAAPSDAATTAAGAPRLAYLFPGHGGQSVGMARELYASQSVFREAIDRCSAHLAPELGFELRDVLYPAAGDADAEALAEARLADVAVGQAAIFAVEVALARLWSAWGAAPHAVAGHSLGAYAAAVTAGVLTLEDALTLVLVRGRILASLPPGAMLAVALPERELAPLLGDTLSIAAINGAEQCTASGPEDAVVSLQRALVDRGVDTRLLRIPRAGHSRFVEPHLERFARAVDAIEKHAPKIPWISDTTGEPVTHEGLRSARFWTDHLRQPVRFHAALTHLLVEDGATFLLEVGPGRTLTTLARRHEAFRDRGEGATASSLPHPAEPASDVATALTAAGRLWVAGAALEWRSLHDGRRFRRVPLPTYPFERRRYLVGETVSAPDVAEPTAGTDLERRGEATPPSGSGDALGVCERRIASLFGEVLGLAHVQPSASFFELGGDSLLAVQLARRIRTAFSIELRPKAIFGAPTARALARAVMDARREGGGGPPTP